MNIQEIAQSLVNDLDKEIKTKDDDKLKLQGAIQGINLLFTKLLEQQATNEQDSEIKDSTSKKKDSGKK